MAAHNCPTRRISIVIIILVIVLSILSTVVLAQPSCASFPRIIVTEADLNDAIACYNIQTIAGIYEINIAANITLTANTTPIDNPTADIELVINGDDNVVDGNDSFRPFTIAANTVVTIDHLTIQHGFNEYGGGIYVDAAILTLTHSTVADNTARAYGGGIYVSTGTLTLINNTVSDNAASFVGGGIYAHSGTLTLTDSTVSGNAALGGSGGGLAASGGTLSLTNSIFSDNTATIAGGGFSVSGGTVSVTHSTISGNSAQIGGGLYVSTGTLTLTNSTVADNAARDFGGGIIAFDNTLSLTNSIVSGNTAQEGGGIYAFDNTLILTNSTVSGNSSTSVGGGILPFGGTLTLINSTVSGNAASEGGGIYTLISTATVTNSTVSGNSASSGSGGGVFNGEMGITILTNSIIADSPSGSDCVGTVNFAGLNLIEDGSCNAAANGQLTGDPMLAPLANNGGTTQTHALLSSSPAIDVGVNALAVDVDSNPLQFDQRGTDFPRIISGTVDLGAYELDCTFPIVVTTEGQLNSAIACYNAQTIAGIYEINIAANITLTANTTPIDNPTADIELVINGDDNVVDGYDSFRPFTIATNTVVTIDHLTIQHGFDEYGGGIYVDTGILTLTHSTVADNSARYTGGGIYTYSGTLTLTDSTVSGNSVTGSGGGIYAHSGTLTLINSTVSGNSATGGGGIFTVSATTTLINSTVSGNSATGGGGIYTAFATTTLTNSTVARNYATTGFGGGVVIAETAIMTLTNSIIADSFLSSDCHGIVIFTGLNLIEDGSCNAAANGQFIGTGDSGDPMLAPLSDNGGTTQTHALLPSTPAIDVGVNSLAVDADSNPLIYDQRGTGFPRIIGGTVDLGAYEAPDPCTGQSPDANADLRNGNTHLNAPYNNGNVSNTSFCFSYEISIAVYKVLDTPGSPHLLHDAETVTVGPNETVNFGINLPDCMVEIYLFYGPVIVNLDNETYVAQGRELDSQWLNGTGPCPDPSGGGGTNPNPNPNPELPVCTPNPDGDLKHSGSHLNPPFDNGTVTNLSDVCIYEVGIASYAVIDGSIDTQQFLGSQTMSIGPGQTVNLGPVPLADGCTTQVDLFYGGVIIDFSGGARYGNRLLDVRWLGSGNCGEG